MDQQNMCVWPCNPRINYGTKSTVTRVSEPSAALDQLANMRSSCDWHMYRYSPAPTCPNFHPFLEYIKIDWAINAAKERWK